MYDASLGLIGQQSGWGGGDTLTVNFAGQSAGTYYVKVEGYGNDSGDGTAG